MAVQIVFYFKKDEKICLKNVALTPNFITKKPFKSKAFKYLPYHRNISAVCHKKNHTFHAGIIDFRRQPPSLIMYLSTLFLKYNNYI